MHEGDQRTHKAGKAGRAGAGEPLKLTDRGIAYPSSVSRDPWLFRRGYRFDRCRQVLFVMRSSTWMLIFSIVVRALHGALDCASTVESLVLCRRREHTPPTVTRSIHEAGEYGQDCDYGRRSLASREVTLTRAVYQGLTDPH